MSIISAQGDVNNLQLLAFLTTLDHLMWLNGCGEDGSRGEHVQALMEAAEARLSMTRKSPGTERDWRGAAVEAGAAIGAYLEERGHTFSVDDDGAPEFGPFMMNHFDARGMVSSIIAGMVETWVRP